MTQYARDHYGHRSPENAFYDPVVYRTPKPSRLYSVAGILAAIAYLFFACWALRITPEQVQACVDYNGWSAERCEMELGR